MIDFPKTPFHTEGEILAQFQRAGWKTRTMERLARTIAELRQGEAGVLDKIELPAGEAQRLMELGFLPGTSVTAAQGSPLGHTRVFRVDGSEVALRRETADRLFLQTAPAPETT